MPPAVSSILQTNLPIPVVAVILLQTAGLAWVGADKYSNLSMRLAVLEKVAEAQVGQKDRIIVLEQTMGNIREDLSEIKALIRGQQQGVLQFSPTTKKVQQ